MKSQSVHRSGKETKIIKASIGPEETYGAEFWTLDTDIKWLAAFERKVLRRKSGVIEVN